MLELKILNNLFVKNNNELAIQETLALDNKFFSKPMQRIIDKCKKKYSADFSLDIDLLQGCDEDFLLGMYDVSDSKLEDNSKYLKELKNRYFANELRKTENNLNEKDLLQKVESIRDEILNENKEVKMVSLKKVRINYYENLEKQRGQKPLKTGWKKFDNYIQCMPGDLVIVCARPGAGKTAFTMNLVLNMAKQGKRGLFFSLEMSESSVINRIMSIVSKVELNKIKDIEKFDRLTDKELHKINEASIELDRVDSNLKISSGSITLDKIKSLCKATKGEFDYIAIDYLQLIRANGKDRFTQVTEISLCLKEIAMECNMPVIALSQLSREVEKRADKRPMLSDLRESGQIEQDASIVIGLYRDAYYNPETDDERLMEVGILKNRDGVSSCTIHYEFVGENQNVWER
ncbi:MAG: replicative DNA helicase [Sarcina sp.]